MFEVLSADQNVGRGDSPLEQQKQDLQPSRATFSESCCCLPIYLQQEIRIRPLASKCKIRHLAY